MTAQGYFTLGVRFRVAKPKPIREVKPVYIEPILWIPGQGPDMTRLRALEKLFPKPHEPLGEAWFIGKTRRMFDDLNANGIEGVAEENLGRYVNELVLGLSSFSEMSVWAQWYGYLAPRLLDTERFDDLGWYHFACQGLMALVLSNPESDAALYEAEFATVLFPWIMQASYWDRHRYIPLHKDYRWQDVWLTPEVNASISQALFMAWRYLPPHALQPWLRSAMAIKNVKWRAHLIFWLVKVGVIFERGMATYPVLKECKFGMLWSESYWWFNSANTNSHPERKDWALIPAENIAALHEAIQREFKSRTYFEWIDQFAARADLWPQMELWLNQFQQKYL